jgi:hypothetical protein
VNTSPHLKTHTMPKNRPNQKRTNRNTKLTSKQLYHEQLHILHLNIHGICTSEKYTYFTQYIADLQTKPDIIFINEHWVENADVKSFFVNGYFLAASYGRKKKSGGGSLILVRDFLRPYTKEIKIKSVQSKFEVCGAKIDINNTKLTIISLYRPSNAASNREIPVFFENLEDLLERHRGSNDIILAGDLNIDCMKEEPNAIHLLDIFRTYNMSLVNTDKITRANDSSNGGTLIDHIFTNIAHNSPDTHDYTGSDHKAVSCNVNLPVNRPKDYYKQTRTFSDENWKMFNDLLIKEDWQQIYEHGDLDEKSSLFMEKIVDYFNTSFPLKKVLVRANQINKVNLSAPTRVMKSKLLKISDEINSTLCDVTKERLKKERCTLRKRLSACIRSEMKTSNDSKIKNSKNKSSTAWKILKESTGRTKADHQISALNVNGKIENIKLDIANALNHSFIVPTPVQPAPPSDYDFVPPDCKVPFVLHQTTEAEVYSVICKLSSKKSSGWDEISVETLKRISLFILKPLCHLINCSFKAGKFPKNMKLAKIIAIYKKGEKEDANNYRPIAITSSFSKVFEKIFLNRLEYHFEQNNIINPQQHGFQKNKSTVTALFDFASQIYNSIDAREKINVILYDFSNAFGTLYPQLLLRKLKIYGVTDDAISWLCCFLTQREQYVQIRDVDCDGTEITINSERLISDMGVPQGTILGPTSFITYSNDLSLRMIIAMLILFADDSTIIATGKTLVEANANTVKANHEMVKFSDDNLLYINASKTKIMQIHTHQTRQVAPPPLVIKGVNVENASQCKLLGVEISDTLSWQPQCDKVANKLRSVTYMFTILRDAVSESSLKLIYYAYAQSQILYSIVIWGGSSHLEKVFVAQKRVLRAMSGLRYWRSNCALDSCRPLFASCGILTVYSLYILECMKFLVKHPEKFRRKCDVPNSKSPKTKIGKIKYFINDIYVEIEDHRNILNQNPVVNIARIFNNFPVPIKMIEDGNEFICKVKEIVWKFQFYDMKEFFSCKFE